MSEDVFTAIELLRLDIADQYVFLPVILMLFVIFLFVLWLFVVPEKNKNKLKNVGSMSLQKKEKMHINNLSQNDALKLLKDVFSANGGRKPQNLKLGKFILERRKADFWITIHEHAFPLRLAKNYNNGWVQLSADNFLKEGDLIQLRYNEKNFADFYIHFSKK